MGDKGAGSSSSAQQAEQPKPESIAYYFNKLKQGDTAKWEKDELLNVIYWWRQVCGVLLGVVLGLADVHGMMGIITFFMTNIAVTLGILKSVLGIDEDQYGGVTELMGEGLMGSFASFMVAWILSYSGLHSS